MRLNYIILGLIILLSACLSSGNDGSQTATETGSRLALVSVQFSDENMLSRQLEVPEGLSLNAFEALDSVADIEFTQYAFGKFITGINGVKAGENEYWAVYMDGNYALQGIDFLELDEGSSLALKLEKSG